MLFTLGRVGAVIAMDVKDYKLPNYQRTFLRRSEAHNSLFEDLKPLKP